MGATSRLDAKVDDYKQFFSPKSGCAALAQSSDHRSCSCDGAAVTAENTWIAEAVLALTQPSQRHGWFYSRLPWICLSICLPKAALTLCS